jgi:MFS family permease
MDQAHENEMPLRAPDLPAPRWREMLLGPRARIIWTISIGVAIQAFGWFLVSTIMPSVVLELGKPELLSWGTTAFLALSIPGSASAGYLKGRFGTRRLLIVASLVVIAANLAGLASPTMAIFLLSRALQGLGEGLVLALCYILVGESLPAREVSPAFGIIAVVWALATLIGPWLAGLLTELFSWRLSFVPMLLLTAAFLWLVATDTAKRPASSNGPAALPIGRLTIIGLAIIAVSFAGATRDVTLASLLIILTLGLLALCFRIDRRSASRLFPQRLLSLRQPASLGIWILGLMYGAEAVAPLYNTYFVQIGHGTSVFFAGQFSAILAVSWSATAILIARLGKVPGKTMLVLGPALLAAGLGLLIFWHDLPLAIAALGLAAMGCGFGLSYGFFTEYVIGFAPSVERDVTAGAIPSIESTCAAIGAAVAGLIGNAAGFGRHGAADIPALVPILVYGASTAIALIAVAWAWRFRRLAIAAGI